MNLFREEKFGDDSAMAAKVEQSQCGNSDLCVSNSTKFAVQEISNTYIAI